MKFKKQEPPFDFRRNKAFPLSKYRVKSPANEEGTAHREEKRSSLFPQ